MATVKSKCKVIKQPNQQLNTYTGAAMNRNGLKSVVTHRVEIHSVGTYIAQRSGERKQHPQAFRQNSNSKIEYITRRYITWEARIEHCDMIFAIPIDIAVYSV